MSCDRRQGRLLAIGLMLALWHLQARADIAGAGLVTALEYLSLWPISIVFALALARPGRKLLWVVMAAVGAPCAWVAVRHVMRTTHAAFGWGPASQVWIYPVLLCAMAVALVAARMGRADPRPLRHQQASADTDLLVLLLVAPVMTALPREPWVRDLLVPGVTLRNALRGWDASLTMGLSLLAAFALWRRYRWGWWLALVLAAVRSLALLESLRMFAGRSFTGYDHSGGAATVIAMLGLLGYAALALVFGGTVALLLRPRMLEAFFERHEAPRRWFSKAVA